MIQLHKLTDSTFEVFHSEDEEPKTVHESVHEVSKPSKRTVCKVSEAVHQNVFNRLWTLKRTKTHTKHTRTHHLRQLLVFAPGIVVVMSILSTLLHTAAIIQQSLYLLFIGLFIAIDPLELFTRWLALQTRILVLIDCSLIILGLLVHDLTYSLISFLFILVTFTLVRFLNTSWLFAENWSMTEEVQKAAEFDNEECMSSWQAHGKRESRTLLYELGHEVNEEILQIFVKPVYSLGFLHGIKKVNTGREKETRSKLKNLSEELKTCKREMKEAEIEIQEFTAKNEELYANLQAFELDHERMRAEYYKILQENNELLQANEELMQEIEQFSSVSSVPKKNNEVAAELPEQEPTEEEQIKTLLLEGGSIRQVATALGIPKCRVERVKKGLSY